MVGGLLWALIGGAAAQTPSASALQRDIAHLQVAGSVLYVAAHPDDENTALIAWMVGSEGLSTAYLSMTRGGGGQNLIGSEQSELLGVVRTGELLAARSIDGAEQRFTRARDFGFSKSPDEALAIWGHDDALADVVLAIRTFRPDVIVTRFGAEGGGHGHHTASAWLAREAFDAAADPARFPVDGVAPWQADRLLVNKSAWWIEEGTDTSTWPRVDVGTYDPRIGQSYGEVAAASRTMHKSQGFGAAPSVGPKVEFLLPVAGTAPPEGGDPFAGLDWTLGRFAGTKPLVKVLAQAADRFDPERPDAVLPLLAKAHGLLGTIPDETWRARKTAALEQAMVDCAGLWLTARADRAAAVPGTSLTVTLTAVARNPVPVTVRGVRVDPGPTSEAATLAPNAPWTTEVTVDLPADKPLTRPHWLAEPPGDAMYRIDDPALRTAPDTRPSLTATFDLEIAGARIAVERPVVFAWTDRVDGERTAPVEVLPPVTATFDQRGILVPIGSPANARLTLRAPTGPAKGTLRLEAPPGVTVTPAEVPFDLVDGALERTIALRISADGPADPAPLRAVVEVGGRSWSLQQAVIDHGHLPRRTILSQAELPVVPVALDRGGVTRIGYVPGSGDAVPGVLRSVGYVVEEIDEDAIVSGDLSRFDAVILGIRAYNTRPRLQATNDALLTYVERGGRVLMQYNTNGRWSTFDGLIGPAPFAIGRGRVTDETAALVPVDPAHAALVGPNALGPADFDGWVQERGLYFAESWDPAWQPLFAANDPGEEPLQGGVLIARHGDGVFVYTGLAFFRQLPAGVPGGMRLMANLLAL